MRLREPMPEMPEAYWLNGEARRGDLVSKIPTLVHFWSVSCHQCKEAMPLINDFHRSFTGRLNVLAVHMPRSEEDLDIDSIKKAAADHGIRQPMYLDHDRKLSDLYGNKFVPAYYLFDHEGRLRHFQAGRGGMQMLEKRVGRMLNELETKG